MSHAPLRSRRLLALVSAGFCVAIGAVCNGPGSEHAPRIVVKFAEGLVVTPQGKSVRIEAPRDAAGRDVLARSGVGDATIAAERAQLAELLSQPSVAHVAPLFSDDARGLQPDPSAGTPRDLRLYVSVVLHASTPQADADALARRLDALAVVETAYPAPVGEDPGMATPTP